MELSIKDRLDISFIFPQQGDLLSQIMIKEISEKTLINSKEIAKIELRQQGNTVIWNKKKCKDKIIIFTEAELNLLKDAVEKLDKEKKITQNILSLCLKIKNEKNNS